jgi:hypothetical protein
MKILNIIFLLFLLNGQGQAQETKKTVSEAVATLDFIDFKQIDATKILNTGKIFLQDEIQLIYLSDNAEQIFNEVYGKTLENHLGIKEILKSVNSKKIQGEFLKKIDVNSFRTIEFNPKNMTLTFKEGKGDSFEQNCRGQRCVVKFKILGNNKLQLTRLNHSYGNGDNHFVGIKINGVSYYAVDDSKAAINYFENTDEVKNYDILRIIKLQFISQFYYHQFNPATNPIDMRLSEMGKQVRGFQELKDYLPISKNKKFRVKHGQINLSAKFTLNVDPPTQPNESNITLTKTNPHNAPFVQFSSPFILTCHPVSKSKFISKKSKFEFRFTTDQLIEAYHLEDNNQTVKIDLYTVKKLSSSLVSSELIFRLKSNKYSLNGFELSLGSSAIQDLFENSTIRDSNGIPQKVYYYKSFKALLPEEMKLKCSINKSKDNIYLLEELKKIPGQISEEEAKKRMQEANQKADNF